MKAPPLRSIPILCAAVLLLGQLAVLIVIGNGLSYLADPYSEANALRAGEGYAAKGFLEDSALPDTAYGGRFPGKGILSRDPPPTENIYTHYPSGADLMAGVWTVLFGPGRIALYRIPVILFGVAAFLFLVRCVSVNFGPRAAAATSVLLLLTPATSTHLHSLHYHGYGFALLLFQAGVLVNFLSHRRSSALGAGAALLALGFLQGVLSFDWAFVVTFLGGAVGLVALADGRTTKARVLLAVVLPGLGFTLAHGAHVLQLVHYWGGLDLALQDLLESAGERGTGADAGQPLPANPLFLIPFTLFASAPIHLGPLAAFPIVGAVLLIAMRSLGFQAGGIVDAGFSLERGRMLASAGLVLAFVAANAWTIVMAQHAASHWHFVPRHYLALLFTCGYLLLAAGQNAPVTAPAAGTRTRP